MLFSIIIPVYNVEQYLADCLQSALDQSFNDYEVICINDGSTDKSHLILNKYAKQYDNIRIINQENKGCSAAKNVGIKAAIGDYIFLLDSDDWIENNSLEVLAEQLNGEDMICFNGQRFFEDGKTEQFDKGVSEEKISGWEYYNKYALAPRKFSFISPVLRTYRRNFITDNNLFFKFGIFHEDNLFTPLACYYAKNVKVINVQIYNYRIHKGSITQSENFKKIIDITRVANDLSSFFIPLTGIRKDNIYKSLASHYIGLFKITLYGKFRNRINEVIDMVNFKYFRKVCITHRHKWLYLLICINPKLLLLYYKTTFILKNSLFTNRIKKIKI